MAGGGEAPGILALCRVVSSNPGQFTVLYPLTKAPMVVHCHFSVFVKLRDLFKFQSLTRREAETEIPACWVMNWDIIWAAWEGGWEGEKGTEGREWEGGLISNTEQVARFFNQTGSRTTIFISKATFTSILLTSSSSDLPVSLWMALTFCQPPNEKDESSFASSLSDRAPFFLISKLRFSLEPRLTFPPSLWHLWVRSELAFFFLRLSCWQQAWNEMWINVYTQFIPKTALTVSLVSSFHRQGNWAWEMLSNLANATDFHPNVRHLSTVPCSSQGRPNST